MDTKLFCGKHKISKAATPDESSEDEDFSDDDSVADETYLPDPLEETDSSIMEDDDLDEAVETAIQSSEPLTIDKAVDETSAPNLQNSTVNIISNEAHKANGIQKSHQLIWKQSTEVHYSIYGSQLPPSMAVESPLNYFHRLVNTTRFEKISKQTNLYAAQSDICSNFHINAKELELTLIPGTRRYWNNKCRIPYVADVMACHRWEQIKHNLHFADNSTLPVERPDRLFKIKMLIESVKDNLKNIPLEQHLSMDEQIVPYKGKSSSLKQYNPKKPKKWGYKIFCLAGAIGIIYDFEIYCGTVEHPTTLLNISASSNVVLRLAQRIPNNKNFVAL